MPLAAPKPSGLAGAAIHVPFATLGAYEPLRLRGSDTARTVNVGVRLDRMVTAARLRLTYTYSPSLVFPVSHLKVSINGEAVATLPFDSEHAGRAVTQEIPLDARYFTDFNQIELRLIAHYTLDHCEDPEHSALWADVSPTSELIFDEASVRLPNDLALLPAPFFDRRDNSRLRLPFVLPATPDDATLRSAGVLASWFGALADYRQARFPVSSALPANDHAVVVGTAARLPASLALPPIDGPMLVVTDNPAAPDKKLLVVTGRSAADVDAATNALVLGNAALSGPWARVSRIDIGAPRKPYDAPRWVPVDRPVALRELVDSPADLQVRGSAPDPIRLNLRVPADLHSWGGSGVPLALHYRYTAPTVRSDSMLAVEINDQLVQSYRLSPRSQDARGRMQLPLLSGADSRATNDVDIPAFRVGSANQLQLRFTLDSEKTGLCTGVASEPQRAAIDPDSTIDFSRFIHYAMLPNLAYFANSGFPFTRYADLSQTAVVLPPRPSPAEQEAYLTMLGHMGQWTGFPALRVRLARAADAPAIADKDLLVIDGAPPYAQLANWRDALPVAIGEATAGGGFSRAAFSVKERWHDDARSPAGGARDARVDARECVERAQRVFVAFLDDPQRQPMLEPRVEQQRIERAMQHVEKAARRVAAPERFVDQVLGVERRQRRGHAVQTEEVRDDPVAAVVGLVDALDVGVRKRQREIRPRVDRQRRVGPPRGVAAPFARDAPQQPDRLEIREVLRLAEQNGF